MAESTPIDRFFSRHFYLASASLLASSYLVIVAAYRLLLGRYLSSGDASYYFLSVGLSIVILYSSFMYVAYRSVIRALDRRRSPHGSTVFSRLFVYPVILFVSPLLAAPLLFRILGSVYVRAANMLLVFLAVFLPLFMLVALASAPRIVMGKIKGFRELVRGADKRLLIYVLGGGLIAFLAYMVVFLPIGMLTGILKEPILPLDMPRGMPVYRAYKLSTNWGLLLYIVVGSPLFFSVYLTGIRITYGSGSS